MRPLLVTAAVGALLGLGLGLGGRWLTRPEPAPLIAVPDSAPAAQAARGSAPAAPDSTAHDRLVAADSVTAAPAAHTAADVAAALPRDTAASLTAEHAAPAPDAPAVAAGRAPLTTAVPVLRGGAQGPEAARRLARIFGAMRPAEAAAVLAQMDDADIREILFNMTERTAGAILGQLPPDRAAALSRAALRRPAS